MAPTLNDVRQWPATVDVPSACRALGISRSHGYDAVASGKFPARVIRVGRRFRVVTADLVRLLGGEPQGSAA
jgi:predicted DNA-binding transcriptional regulator AlpA